MDKEMKKKIFYGALAGLGAAAYCYYAFYKIIFVDFGISGYDFRLGYTAARDYLAGRSIYIMPADLSAFFYFPGIVVLYLPFSWLPMTAAKSLWFAMGHILALCAAYGIYSFGRKKGRLLSLAAVATAYVSTPLYQTFFIGNINIFIFFGLYLVYAEILSGRARFSPYLIAGFSAIKVMPALLMGFFLRERAYPAFVRFFGFLLFLALLSLSVFGLRENLNYFVHLRGLNSMVGPLQAMSLTYFLKLFWPEASASALLLPNIVLALVLGLLWWLAPGRAAVPGPGSRAADLFTLSVAVTLLLPSSWLTYSGLFLVPFYFVIHSLLEERKDFKAISVFVAVFVFLNFWEIIAYHLPLGPGRLTFDLVWHNRSSYPALFPFLFSLQFVAALLLFVWTIVNYKALAANMERITGAWRAV